MDYKGLKELLEGCISDKAEEFPAELDSLIADTARTGIVRLPWELLKPLFDYRLKKVLMASFDELALEGEDKALHQQLLDQLNKFDNPPFTIQRVCELIVEPTKHYKKRDRYMRAMERCLLVVSTQEPDLTWMKSPRLTQLLEEPPKESLQEVVFDEDMVNEYAAVPASGSTANLWSNLRQITTNDDSEQPSSPSESDHSTTTTTKAAKPVSPASREKEEKGEEASTSTTEVMDDKSSTTSANSASLMDDDDSFEDNTPESSSNSPERGDAEDKKPPLEGAGQFPLSRKRSSSMRDSMEGSGSEGGGEREEDARGTVLQEADSTTLGGEHDDNGRDEGMEGGGAAEAGEEGRSQEEEEEADRDLEQSTPKKRRSKSPEIETKSSSLEGDRLDNLNIVDAKVTVSDTAIAGGELEKKESSQDALESESSLSLKKRLQPGLVESEEEGEGGGRGSEREEVAAIAELHSSSGDEGEVRETSTGQLERSHDSKTDSAVSLASEQMETAP